MLLKRKDELEMSSLNAGDVMAGRTELPHHDIADMPEGVPVVERSLPQAPMVSAEPFMSNRMAPHKMEDGEEPTPTSWLNELFMESMRMGVSDIHIIPEREYTSVRFRIGGVVSEVARWDVDYHDMVISRIKVISGLQVVEKNIPQDGHLELAFEVSKSDLAAGQKMPTSLNFRVSTMPTINGEVAVLRVLSKEGTVLSLSEVGFSEKSFPVVKKMLQRGHGVILMTGHSGSGKTTTLYAALNEINASEKAILTLEDPVEYRVPSVRQSQVNPAVGYTFSAGLKAMLRQDPDVIMIGEIRDEETAGIAMRLALVGRLVLTTLHTSNISGALTRMIDMDIGKSIIASAFTGIVAERLVRKICPSCRIEAVPPYELMKMFDITWPENEKVYAGQGCPACGGTGFLERIGIFEVLEVDEEFRNIILSGMPISVLEEYVRKHVVETLRDDGYDKVRKGITTLEEVIRATI
ncbi:MAG: GspE/PulE family protein [Candidatus Paceibacterota bacterium]|jgi:type II secretory ATPase GspE/PulE/Tfp pilus assembly ATPase PilB-like protein